MICYLTHSQPWTCQDLLDLELLIRLGNGDLYLHWIPPLYIQAMPCFASATIEIYAIPPSSSPWVTFHHKNPTLNREHQHPP